LWYPAREVPTKLFQPGQSGNPGGRPKGHVAYIKKLAGEHLEAYVDRLDEIARGRKNADAISAIKILIAYTWGKPIETVVQVDPAVLRELSDADLEAALRVAEKLTGG